LTCTGLRRAGPLAWRRNRPASIGVRHEKLGLAILPIAMTDEMSIQESMYPELTCFGCGHANSQGFHLRSYRAGDLTVAEFIPRPEHDNGFGFLNGGIISTVLDCHGAAVVMWEASQRGWRAAAGAPVPFITAGFDVRFLRPTPLGTAVRLTASPVSVDEDEIVVESALAHEDKQRATMTATWRRFRPRL
jgi:acyl-coenzyme A thioesterase PaaI-like protein